MTGFNDMVDSKDLTYSIKLTDCQTGGSRNAVINSAGTHATVTGLAVGNYDILVEVSIFGIYPYGKGEIKAFPVSAGQNNTTVKMQNVFKLIEMVRIPAGTFEMGSPPSEPGRSTTENQELQHTVTLTEGFYMGIYPVTQAQYEAIMNTNPSEFGGNPNYPVERVSWYDALVFCNRLSLMEGLTPAYSINGSTYPDVWGTVPASDNATWNAVTIVPSSTGYRLPTEAQWEYACRAGTTTAFNDGVTDNFNDAAAVGLLGWYYDNSNSSTQPVGEKPVNNWGLYDMPGNVAEWCWDWFAVYTAGAKTDPTGAVTGDRRVGRGGSWNNIAQGLRSATRYVYSPSVRDNYIGFRLVRP